MLPLQSSGCSPLQYVIEYLYFKLPLFQNLLLMPMLQKLHDLVGLTYIYTLHGCFSHDLYLHWTRGVSIALSTLCDSFFLTTPSV